MVHHISRLSTKEFLDSDNNIYKLDIHKNSTISDFCHAVLPRQDKVKS